MADTVIVNRPIWTLTSSGIAYVNSVTRPSWTLSATGEFSGWSSTAEVTRPAWTLSAASESNNPWQISVTRPSWTLSALGGNVTNIIRPAWTLSAAGVAGFAASASVTRPSWSLSAAALQSGVGVAALTRRSWSLAALGYSTSPGVVVARRASWSLTASGILSNLASASLTRAPWTLSGAGYAPASMSASLVRPAWQLFAYGPGTDSSIFRTWAVNLPKKAVTEYTGLAPVGFAQIGQNYYMATGAGLFRLGIGDTDNGVEIASQVDLGKNDFGSSFHKRLPRVYVSGKFSGAMEVHTVLAETGRRKYLLVDNLNPGFVQRRVPMGRGPRSRYWQIGFANREGADFTLGSVLALPTRDSRRIS